MNQRGLALGNTLVVIAVAAILAFTVSALSVNHLSFATRLANLRQAQDLAESTVALAIAHLYEDPAFHGEVTLAGARLTFDPSAPDFSTNNLDSPNPTQGSDPNNPVPKYSARLIAVASYHGVSRTVEATVYVPPFPYVIASAAPFSSSGNFLLGAVSSSASLSNLQSLDPSSLVKANLASNAPGAGALVIGPNSQVTGDLVAVGQVVVDPTDRIGGQIRPGAEAVAIPKQDVTSYDPELLGKPNLQMLSAGSYSGAACQGFVKTNGNLSITDGLTLNNGVLYVNGDLSVAGGVHGTGAIFVTGKTGLSGGAQLSTDNTVAIVSRGDVSIRGTGQYSSYFQGMIYTEGSFTADQMTLLGTFIQNGPGARVSISDSRLISVPEYANIQVTADGAGPPPALQNANLLLKKNGESWEKGKYDGSGPLAFEVYPTTNGGYELVDPNTQTLYRAPDVSALTAQIGQLLDAYHDSHTPILALSDAAGGTAMIIPSGGAGTSNKLPQAVRAALSGVKPKPPSTPSIIPPPPGASGGALNLSPSRFLSVKDQLRMLYWRVH